MRTSLLVVFVFTLFFLSLFVTSCANPFGDTSVQFMGSDGAAYTLVVIDGCEYLNAYYRLTHKGNCNNPFHESKGK